MNMLDSLGRERLTVISSSSILLDACDSRAREETGGVPHSMGRMGSLVFHGTRDVPKPPL